MNDKRKPVIVCTGMCDTKGNEIQFLAEQVEAFGGEAVIVDVSLGSASPAWAHIRNDEVLAKAGIEQASDVFTAPLVGEPTGPARLSAAYLAASSLPDAGLEPLYLRRPDAEVSHQVKSTLPRTRSSVSRTR